MKPVVMRVCIILGVMVAGSHSVQASIVMNYGDYTAATIDYIQDRESTSTLGDTVPLYGNPTVSGNTMDLDPNGFAASSAGGIPDITDGNLTFDIYAHAGSVIEEIQFSEAGDFTLLGVGTDNTFVDLYEVDEIGIDMVSSSVSMTFNANASGIFSLLNDGGGDPLNNGIWVGDVNINIDDILALNGIEYSNGATRVSVNLDNTLVALSEVGTQSIIQTNDFSGFSVTAIPEPATMGFIFLFTGGLWFARRFFAD